MVNVYLSGQDARNAAADLWQQDQLQRVNDQYAPPPQPAPEPAQVPPPAPVEAAAGGQGSSLPPSPAVGPVRATPVFQTPAAVTPNPTPDRNDIADQWQRGAIADAWEKDALSDVYKGVSQAGQGVQSALSQVPQQAQGLTSNLAALPGAQPTPPAQPAPGAISGIPALQPTQAQVATVAGGGGTDVEQYIRQSAAAHGIDSDTAVRVAQSEGGLTNPVRQSDYVDPSTGQREQSFGPFQLYLGGGLGNAALKAGIDPRDPNQWRQAVDFALDQAAKGGWSPWHGAARAGVGNFEGIGQAASSAGQAIASAGQTVGTAIGQAVGGLQRPSQFALGLSDADAYAACGPAAAIAFARAFGRNPTGQEALQLAQQSGWTQGGGMNGVVNEKKLMDALGVPTRLETGDVNWSKVTGEVSAGNPVVVSTPGHYFTVDDTQQARDGTTLYHVGSSGTDLKGGSEWMSAADMQRRMGVANGALFADHPQASGPSIAEQAAGVARSVAAPVQQKAQDLLSTVSNLAQPAQQTAQGLINTVGNVGQGIGNAWQQAGQQNAANPMMQNMIASSSPSTINPYRDIVQQGVPNIIGGIQTGDIGRVLGGGLQTIGGITSALPGGEGQIAGQAATTVGEVASNPAVQAALRSRLPGEAEAGFAMGFPTGEVRPPGGGLTVPPVPPQAGDTALQDLINVAKQRGYDTADLESQIRPPGAEPPPTIPPAPPAALPPETPPPPTPPAAPEPSPTPVNPVTPWDIIQTTRVGSLAGGVPTVTHIALNTPLQAGWKLFSNAAQDIVERHPETIPMQFVGAWQGLRNWAMNASQTLTAPGQLAERMGGGAGAQALETGLLGLVKTHPVLQDLAGQVGGNMELWRQAAKQATDSGLTRLSGPWQAEVQRLVSNPTPEIQAAVDRAQNTFALRGPMGFQGQKVADWLQNNELGRFIMPFFNIGYHVATEGIERSPAGLIGTAYDVARSRFGAGPYAAGAANQAVTPLAERFTNNLVGTGLFMEAYSQAASGNITGNGPDDPKQRAELQSQGWMPNSTLIGGRWVDNHVLGPMGWALGEAANLAEARGDTPYTRGTKQATQQDGMQQAASYLTRMGTYLQDETFLRSFGQLLQAAGSGAQAGRMGESVLASMAGSLVPQGGLIANVASAVDPNARRAQPGDIAQSLMTRFPGLREQVPARLTGAGEPEQNPQYGAGVLLPRSGTGQPSPILTLLSGAGITLPTTPPQNIPYSGRQLTLNPDEQQLRQQVLGQRLQQTMQSYLGSTQFQQLSPGQQKRALEPLVRAAEQYADQRVIAAMTPDDRKARLAAAPRTGAAAPVYPTAGAGLAGMVAQESATARQRQSQADVARQQMIQQYTAPQLAAAGP